MDENKSIYCEVDVKHIIHLLEWLFDEVASAGGDGDALWYSKYYHIDDILPLLKQVNEKYNWKITVGPKWLHIGHYQEGFMISNDNFHYENAPVWQQVLIKY